MMKSAYGLRTKSALEGPLDSIGISGPAEISSYMESRGSLQAANRVCRTIYDSVQQLRTFPGSGKAGNAEGTRELVVPQLPAYIIVYRLLENEAVEIVRIWHGAQYR